MRNYRYCPTLAIYLFSRIIFKYLFVYNVLLANRSSSGSRVGNGDHAPVPGPVKISHKKDGLKRRPHRFRVSCPPPYPATGSASEKYIWHLREVTYETISLHNDEKIKESFTISLFDCEAMHVTITSPLQYIYHETIVIN